MGEGRAGVWVSVWVYVVCVCVLACVAHEERNNLTSLSALSENTLGGETLIRHFPNPSLVSQLFDPKKLLDLPRNLSGMN